MKNQKDDAVLKAIQEALRNYEERYRKDNDDHFIILNLDIIDVNNQLDDNPPVKKLSLTCNIYKEDSDAPINTIPIYTADYYFDKKSDVVKNNWKKVLYGNLLNSLVFAGMHSALVTYNNKMLQEIAKQQEAEKEAQKPKESKAKTRASKQKNEKIKAE